MYGLTLFSPADGWIAGERGLILHWDGNAWTREQPAGNDLHAIVMLSADSGWAVGNNGIIMRYRPYVPPTEMPIPAAESEPRRGNGPCGATALVLLPLGIAGWLSLRRRNPVDAI
jgi:hypothetical protein